MAYLGLPNTVQINFQSSTDYHTEVNNRADITTEKTMKTEVKPYVNLLSSFSGYIYLPTELVYPFSVAL